jgi:hypothetical protein
MKVYRRTRGGNLEWCSDYTPDEFIAGELDMVRDEWGSGDYQIRCIGPTGLLMRENLTIAKPLEPLPSRTNPAPSTELAQMIELLARGQERIVEALAARPDPAAQMQQTLALMVSMREAMGLNAAPPPPAPAVNPSSMLADIVGAVRQLREVAAEVNPPTSDPSDPAAMLPMIIDMVRSTQQAQQAQQAPMLAPVALPSSFDAQGAPYQASPEVMQSMRPQPAPMAPPSEGDDMNRIQSMVLRGLLARLLSIAKAGKSPDEGGAWIAEKLPDEFLGYLDLENCVEILISVAPEAAPWRDWLEQARLRALEALEGDEGSDGAPISTDPPRA